MQNIKILSMSDKELAQELFVGVFAKTLSSIDGPLSQETKDLLLSLFDEEWQKFSEKESVALGLWIDEELGGLAFYTVNDPRVELPNHILLRQLVIKSGQQRQGLGREMVAAIFSKVDAAFGVSHRMVGAVVKNNLKAQTFYKDLGVKKIALHIPDLPAGYEFDIYSLNPSSEGE